MSKEYKYDGDINITGQFKQNGEPFSGGGGVTVTDDIDSYVNETGVDKILRKEDENGSVSDAYVVNKIVTPDTKISLQSSAETNGVNYDDITLINSFGGEDNFKEIFGPGSSFNECVEVYSLYYNQNGIETKGLTIGRLGNNIGDIEIVDGTPGKLIKLVVGKYFEYDGQGNKVFDEHSAIYFRNGELVGEYGGYDTIEITEEKQEILVKIDEQGILLFESDGSEIVLGNTRFILYEIYTGEASSIVYKKQNIFEKIIPITWEELVSLRNNKKLIKGMSYRIVDYNTTTVQTDTMSAGHQFDIIVTADSESELNENARAVYHDGDNYFRKTTTVVTSANWIDPNIQPEDIEILYLIDDIQGMNENHEIYGETTESAAIINSVTMMPNQQGVIVPAMLNPDPNEEGNDCYYIYDGTYVMSNFVNNLVTIYYTVDENEDVLYEGVEPHPEDVFVEIDYDNGVPVMYKNDIAGEYGEEGPDYGDQFRYVGNMEIDGTTYNKWDKYEEGSYNGFSILTNVIVVNNQFIMAPEEFAAAVSEEHTIYDKWIEFYTSTAQNPGFLQAWHLTERLVNATFGMKTEKIANLSAWKLKYCLDNDNSKFIWADSTPTLTAQHGDGSNHGYILSIKDSSRNSYVWLKLKNTTDVRDPGANMTVVDDDDSSYNSFVTNSLNPEIGNSYTGSVNDVTILYVRQPQGKSVIYYMKDEWDNECPYDFKNIMFKRYQVTHTSDNPCYDVDNKPVGFYDLYGDFGPYKYLNGGDMIWAYTFSGTRDYDIYEPYDVSTYHEQITQSVIDFYSLDGCGISTIDCCRNNKINVLIKEYDTDDLYCKGRIQLNNIVMYTHLFSLTDEDCFPGYCINNIFGINCNSITLYDNCCSNVVGDDCFDILMGEDCDNNKISSCCNKITLSTENSNNVFGCSNQNIIMGNASYNNHFGANCIGDSLGISTSNNLFGDWFQNNKSIGHLNKNVFGRECRSNDFGSNFEYNTIGNDFTENEFNQNCSHNQFGNACRGNHFGTDITNIIMGNNCSYNYFGYDDGGRFRPENYITRIIVESGCQHNYINASNHDPLVNGNIKRLQNIHIHMGVYGNPSEKNVITVDRGLDGETSIKSSSSTERII